MQTPLSNNKDKSWQRTSSSSVGVPSLCIGNRKLIEFLRVDKATVNLAALMVSVYEHQEAILAVNNNLRGGGLPLKFSQTFSEPPGP